MSMMSTAYHDGVGHTADSYAAPDFAISQNYSTGQRAIADAGILAFRHATAKARLARRVDITRASRHFMYNTRAGIC